MVEVRISRQSGEVTAEAPVAVGVTRLDVEVAGQATQAVAETVRVSRQSGEVVAKNPGIIALTRLDVEEAGKATEANNGTVQVSRQSGEVIASISPFMALTRFDTEVAGKATMASAGSVQISRQSGEAVARRGSAGPVTPLAVPAGWELFLHNWVTTLRLNSSYNTSVKRSPVTGTESRRGLILKPDRTMKLVWQMDDKPRLDRLYVMLRKLTDERGPVPLYCDQRELTASYLATDDTVFLDTSKGRWFVGARVAIVQYDYCNQYVSHSFHIISEDMQDDRLVFTADLGVPVAAGSTIVPMMDCEVVLEAELDHETALNGKLELTVAEVAGASALPPTKADTPVGGQTFQNVPIWDIDPNWVRGIKKGRSRAGKRYGQGRATRVFKEAARSRETVELFLQGERDDIWRSVEFFDTRRGMLRMFWMIDHDSIWETVGIDASGNFINISEFGLFPDFQDELEGYWVGLVMEDGTVYVREAVTVQQVLTVYRITVSPPLPAGLDFTQVVRAARARVTRFEKDEMEEEWTHTGLMSTRLSFIEMLEELDVDIF